MTSSEPAKRPPCATHGLATGPDGRCALCRRSQAPHTPLPVAVAGDGLGSRFVTRLLGLGLLLAAGGTAVYGYQTWQAAQSASLAAAAAQSTPRRGLAPRTQSKPREPAVKPPQAGARAAAAAQSTALEEQQLAAAQRPLALSPEEVERLRQRELESAEQDRRRSAQIEADRQARAERRAREGLSVTLYATGWCRYCKAAREYMTEENIAFVEHDIDASESAREAMKRLNPSGSVPTMDIDGTVLVGFSSAKVDAALEAAVARRAARSR